MKASKLLSSLFLTLILFSTFFKPSFSAELCRAKDKKVLLQIKKAFKNPYIYSGWDSKSDCCDWYGVKCDEKTHQIYSLFATDGDLSGPIPPQVGDLPYLEDIHFHKQPNITGPIPFAISKLKNLRSLIITNTGLTGRVPDFLGQMKNLDFISLSFNSLTGTIPRSIGLLPKLGGLLLDRNKLTGPIPDTFGDFKGNDFYLYLSHNQLSGKIPPSLGRKDFTYIDLSRNRLEGDASFLFGSGKTMIQHVDLSRNLLEFDLSKVKFPKSLIFLDLNHNKIKGSIPTGLTVPEFQQFNVSYNRLCGKIPMGGNLQRFDYSAYFHNRCLCGTPLPKCK
ncbi:polygalacturonase inhibitor-like [Cannabis sativa]|uniref:polygalacturonase inhibitor-like n=1 Tax=Cannabis sativa TaxID=3483 RepID=UPI0029CA0781|nr:polygalacturonase inhibitor-like [Cannabis sativa]